MLLHFDNHSLVFHVTDCYGLEPTSLSPSLCMRYPSCFPPKQLKLSGAGPSQPESDSAVEAYKIPMRLTSGGRHL